MADYPDNYPDDLTPAVTNKHSHRHMVILATPDGAVVEHVDGGLPVTITGVDTTVTLTGDVVVDSLGAVDDTKEVDPDAASATLPGLTRGMLKQLVDILAKLPATPATQSTAADILAKLSADPSSETTLAAVQAATEALAPLLADAATDTTLAAVQAAAEALAPLLADVATETTLATVASKLDDVITAVEANTAAITAFASANHDDLVALLP